MHRLGLGPEGNITDGTSYTDAWCACWGINECSPGRNASIIMTQSGHERSDKKCSRSPIDSPKDLPSSHSSFLVDTIITSSL
jgi:hypothetical protein